MPLIPTTVADEVLHSVGLTESSSLPSRRQDDPIFPILENSGADLSTLVTKMVHIMNTAKHASTQVRCAEKLLELHGYPGKQQDDHTAKINIVIQNGDAKVAQIFNPRRDI